MKRKLRNIGGIGSFLTNPSPWWSWIVVGVMIMLSWGLSSYSSRASMGLFVCSLVGLGFLLLKDYLASINYKFPEAPHAPSDLKGKAHPVTVATPAGFAALAMEIFRKTKAAGIFNRETWNKGSVKFYRFYWVIVSSVFLLMAYGAWRSENTVNLSIDVFLSLLFFLAYMRTPYSAYVLNRLRGRLVGLGILAVAAVLGAYAWGVIWEYRFVTWGSFIALISGLVGLLALWLTPVLNFDDLKPVDGEISAESKWMESIDEWINSPTGRLIFAAAAAFMWWRMLIAPNANTRALYIFVAAGLTLLALPLWIKQGARQMKLPSMAKPVIWLVVVWLGIKGQAVFVTGNLLVGTLYYMAGGFLLAITQSSKEDYFKAERKETFDKLELFALLALMVVALGFRLYKLDTFPWGAEGDEAGGGTWAQEAVNGTAENLLISKVFPMQFVAITGDIFKLFGVSVFTLRIHSVIFGMLSLFAFYFFIREFYGKSVAWITTAVMAFSFYHLHYSRFGHHNIEQVFAQTVSFYFFFKGMRTAKGWMFAIAGIAFGLAMLPTTPSKLVPLIGFGFALYLIILKPGLFIRRIKHIFIFALCGWMLASSALVTWKRAAYISLGRAKTVSIFDKTNTNAPRDTLSGLVENIRLVCYMFNVFGDSRTRNLITVPAPCLEYWTSVLFALSFFYMLFNWRNPIYCFLFIGMFVTMSASILSVEAPSVNRTAGLISIIFAMMAPTIAAFKDTLKELLPEKPKAVALAFLVLMVPLVGYMSYRSMYMYWVDAKNVSFDVLPTLIGESAGKTPMNCRTVFFATGFAAGHPPVAFFSQGHYVGNHYTFLEGMPSRFADIDTPLNLFFCDDFMEAADLAKKLYYPDAKITDVHFIGNGPVIMRQLYVTSEENLASHTPDTVMEFEDGRTAAVTSPGIHFDTTKMTEIPKRVKFHGGFFSYPYGKWALYGQTQGDCVVTLDGRVVSRVRKGRVKEDSRPLFVGFHDLKIEYTPPSSGEIFFLKAEVSPITTGKQWNAWTTQNEQVQDYAVYRPAAQPGLSSSYYADRFLTDHIADRLEPYMVQRWLDPPIPQQWSARFKGKVLIPRAGRWLFQAPTCAYSDLEVDKKPVWRTGYLPPYEGPKKIPPLKPVVPELILKEGPHDIVMEFSTAGCSYVDLMWMGPGDNAFSRIPSENLRPIMGE